MPVHLKWLVLWKIQKWCFWWSFMLPAFILLMLRLGASKWVMAKYILSTRIDKVSYIRSNSSYDTFKSYLTALLMYQYIFQNHTPSPTHTPPHTIISSILSYALFLGVVISSGIHLHFHSHTKTHMWPFSRHCTYPKVFPKLFSVLRFFLCPKYFPILFYWPFTCTKHFPRSCSKLDHYQLYDCLKSCPFVDLVNAANYTPKYKLVPCIMHCRFYQKAYIISWDQILHQHMHIWWFSCKW